MADEVNDDAHRNNSGAGTSVANNKINRLFGLTVPFDVLSVLLGFIVISGGLVGYLKAGSIPSLVAGLVFGILIFIGSYFSSRDATNVYPLLVTCVILFGLMAWRFLKSYKFMPAGLVASLSGIMILRYIYIIVLNRST